MKQNTSSGFFPWSARLLALSGAFLLLVLLNAVLLWPDAVPEALRPVLRGMLLALALALGLLLWTTWRQLREVQAAGARERARLQALIDALPHGIALWNADGTLQQCNAHFGRLYGAILGPLLAPGMRFEDMLRRLVALQGAPGGDAEAWIAQRLLAHRGAGTPPVLRQMPDGHWRQIEEHRLPDGTLLGHSLDVTTLVLREQALQAAQREAEGARQRLEDALDALPDGFVLFDAEDRLVLCNRRYREMYGESADLIQPGAHFEALLREGLARGQFPQAAGREEAWMAERLVAHREPAGPVLQQLPGDRWLRIDERRTRDGGVAGVRADVTELVRRGQALQALNEQLDALNLELRTQSHTDPLTGLANRRLLEQRLDEEVLRAQRHGLPMSLLALDVDHFKRFNDRYGHPAGDEALVQVARALKALARRPADLAARVGGEEFALLLPHAGAAEAQSVAQQVLDAVDALRIPHADSSTARCLTLSVGVATLSRGMDQAALVRAADDALYRAKAEGRHRVAVSAFRDVSPA